MAPGKQCLVCERKSVDVTKPNGLACTYCGLYFHSECSSTFSKVSCDVLPIVKKVCTHCETSLKNLPLRVSNLEQKFVEFVAKTEAVIGGSLPAQCGAVCNTGVDVDKAVKEAISAHDEKLCIILSGVQETGSAVTDKALVKEIFDSLSEDSVFLIDVFRLGKEPNGGSNVKPRLVKVRVANAAQRSVVLRKAKILKESDKFKNVFVRPSLSHTAAERTQIRGLYDIVRKKKNETGPEYYIDRRGPVSQWTIKERRVVDSNSSQQSVSSPSTNP